MAESILYEKHEGVVKLSLNRPEVLNSLNPEMSALLISRLEEIGNDSSVRCVLLTGVGRGFCAGQDLAEFSDDIKNGVTAKFGAIVRERYNPTIRLIREIEKPFICAVNGVAAGAGANLALACDIVVAAETASFVQSFAKIGLIPDSGGTFILPRLIGFGRAQALTMLGEKISAAQALSMGMIYKTFPAEELVTESEKLSAYFAVQPTKGLGFIKRLFNQSAGNDLLAQLDLEEKLQDAAGRTYDYTEGARAFLEKRAPIFRGE